MANFRGHEPVVIEEFNGLWKRGDADSVPIDHFADCNNIQYIESGFRTRDGLDTLIAKGNVARMYNYKLPTGDSFLILTTDGEIFHALLDDTHTVYGPILTIAGMTDFNFVQFNTFAYITPFATFTNVIDGINNDYQKGLENEFVYVYKGDGTNARKAAGNPPSNSDDTPLVAYNSVVDGLIDQGIHVLGVAYLDGGGDRSTALGTTVRPVIYAPGQKQVILDNIPIGPTGTASREIYLTKAIDPKNWNPDLTSYTYFLALTINDNTTTYAILSIADADLVTAFVAGTFDNPTSGGITAKNNDDEGHCDLGLHIIGVVYETDTGYLTAPGPEVFAVCTFVDGNRSIKIESIPTSPDSFVTKRHLVSTKAISLYNGDDHGFQLFFIPDGTIENNTDTEKVVSYFDAELLEDASHLLDNFAEIPAGVVLNKYHNCMILGAIFDDINIVYASFPGEPEAIDQVDGILGGITRDGNPITIAQEFRDVLYVFKKNRTYAYSDNGDVPSTWPKPIPIDEGIGCSVHGIGTVLDSGGVNIDFIIITDFSGIFIFNGAYQRPELSWKILNFWLAQDKNRFDEMQTTNDSIKQVIYINLPDGTILFGDYTNGLNPKDIKWGIWTFDIETNTIALYNNNVLAIGAADATTPPDPGLQLPEAPSNLVAVETNSIQLTWQDNSNNEVGFSIERRFNGGSFEVIHTTAANISSFLDTDVTEVGTYEYRVRAFNDAGNSEYSNIASVTIEDVVPEPPPPGDIISQADIAYVGCFRIPGNWTMGALGGISGRVVDGADRIFLYGILNYFKMTAVISAATNSTTFRIGSVSVGGEGGVPTVGNRINILPTTGLNMPQTTVIQTVTPNGGDYDITISPALSGTPNVGDYVWHDPAPIVEVEVPTTGITGSYLTTVQASLIAAYPDPYRGKRVSWRSGNPYVVSGDPGAAFPANLYYDESSGLLYWTYFDSYSVAGDDDWALGASVLGAPSTPGGIDGAVTSYGPWRVKNVDGDGNPWYGAERFGFISKNPSGNMIGGGITRSGIANNAWGPCLFGGIIPGIATPGGPVAADIVANDRYLNYYYPDTQGSNYYNFDGSVVGIIRQYKHVGPPGYSIIFEPNYIPPRNAVNPAFNLGIATWNAGAEGVNGVVWIQGTNKAGILYAGTLAISNVLDPTSVNANHTWYRSQGQYTINYTTLVGTFIQGETVQGNTSGAQMTSSNPQPELDQIFGPVDISQEFVVGEIVTGLTSGATAVVTTVNRHDVCAHGLAAPGNLAGITGDVSTKSIPAIIIFNPSRLEANKAGTEVDYTTLAAQVIDLEATYGIEVAGQDVIGAGKQINGFWFNPNNNRLYVVAPQADLTLGVNSAQSLVHIFQLSNL